MWDYHLCDVQTGKRHMRLHPMPGGSWARRWGQKAGGRHAFLLSAPEHKGQNLWQLSDPTKSAVVVSWNMQPVYAGIIAETEHDEISDTMTVSHEDIWGVLEGRFLLDRSESRAPASVLSYSGLSSSTLVKRIVQAAVVGPDGDPLFSLPITYPEDVGGTWSAEFLGHQFRPAAEAIQDVMDAANGPMVDFRPYWTSEGRLAWELKVQHVVGTALKFNTTFDDSGVKSLKLKRNAENKATLVHVTGNGMEEKVIWAKAEVPGSNTPAREVLVNVNHLKSQARVNQRATGLAALRGKTTHQVDMVIDGAAHVNPADLILGGRVSFYTADSQVWADGWHDRLLIGFTGDNLTDIKFELQDEAVQ